MLTRKAADVRRRDLRELFDAAADDGFTREAEKRRATVGAMFKWGMVQDIVEADPSLGLTPYDRGEPRERVLGAEEIAKLWKDDDERWEAEQAQRELADPQGDALFWRQG